VKDEDGKVVVLGSGNFAIVYLARLAGKQVAVKVRHAWAGCHRHPGAAPADWSDRPCYAGS
jgi:hypothetical protein